MGELKKSISCYQKVIQIKPNNAVTYNNLGIAYYEAGEIQKAKNCYNKVIQINPNHINAYYNLGEVYRDAKEFKKASDYFKKVDTQLGNAQFLECIYFSNGIKK